MALISGYLIHMTHESFKMAWVFISTVCLFRVMISLYANFNDNLLNVLREI